MWASPIYKLKAASGKYIYIDVTTSCGSSLVPNSIIKNIIKFFKGKSIDKILDFGAGALRHTFPLLEAGLEVWASEYKEQYKSLACKKALEKAKKYANFNSLLFPHEFIKSKERFDAVICAFVIPIMPRKEERSKLLRLLKKKLKEDSFIFWMSQYGRYGDALDNNNRVKDGWYFHPERKLHSFYTEFKNAEVDKMIKRIGFERIKILNTSGHDQFRLYSRGGGTWP